MRQHLSRLRLISILVAALCGFRPGVAAAADDASAPPDLNVVEDRTRGILDGEREAYFDLLEHARQGDFAEQVVEGKRNVARFEREFDDRQQQELAQHPGRPRFRFSLYADLLKQPQAYRGKLIYLRGHIRRLEEMPLVDGEENLGTAYQAYLFTEDSRTHPYIIVCSDVPPDMPRGGDLLEEVAVAGYFFKIYAYDARDTARVAPLVMAKQLEWYPRAEPEPLIPLWWGGLAAGIVLLILVAVLWRIAAQDRRVRKRQLQKLAEGAEPFSSPES